MLRHKGPDSPSSASRAVFSRAAPQVLSVKSLGADDTATAELDDLLRRHHDALFRRVDERFAQHEQEIREIISPPFNRPFDTGLWLPNSASRPQSRQQSRPRGTSLSPRLSPRADGREANGLRKLWDFPGSAVADDKGHWALPGSVDGDLAVAAAAEPASLRIAPPTTEPPVVDSQSVEGSPEGSTSIGGSFDAPALTKESLLLRSRGLERRASQDLWKQKISNLLSTRRERRTHVFKPADMLTGKSKEAAASSQTTLRGIVFSDVFDLCSSVLILTNCIFIAFQLEYVTNQSEKEGREVIPPWSMPVELTFCILFSVELGLRVYVHGRNIIYSKDRAWTVFDGLVVFVSIFEILVDLVADVNRVGGDTSFFRSMRALRVTRAIRVVRVFRFFKELRTLIVTILGSFKTLIWSAVMMVLFWYVCGVILTNATYEACSIARAGTAVLHADCPPLKDRFGTLRRSVLSLYMSMSGGVDWDTIYQIMGPMDEVYKVMFLVYLFFTMFGVLNIVTGIFVESAKEAGLADRDMLVRSQMRTQEKYIKDMIRLFQEIDANGSGTISRKEFQWHLTDERALAYFEALKLDISDVSTLFDLLDINKSGRINIEEFLSGCQRLRGESRALDLAVLRTEVLSWMGHFSNFADNVEKQLDELVNKKPIVGDRSRGRAATIAGTYS